MMAACILADSWCKPTACAIAAGVRWSWEVSITAWILPAEKSSGQKQRTLHRPVQPAATAAFEALLPIDQLGTPGLSIAKVIWLPGPNCPVSIMWASVPTWSGLIVRRRSYAMSLRISSISSGVSVTDLMVTSAPSVVGGERLRQCGDDAVWCGHDWWSSGFACGPLGSYAGFPIPGPCFTF